MRPEYTAHVEERFGKIYVTRQLEDLKPPFTKWDFLSDYERTYYGTMTFGKNCSQCGEMLETEADFAKHYTVPDVQYFNLGTCVKKAG